MTAAEVYAARKKWFLDEKAVVGGHALVMWWIPRGVIPTVAEAKARLERITAEQPGRDIVAVAHGGTIRAAVGLALGNQPETGLAFDIDNCSVTRLDHYASPPAKDVWRLPMVNQQPWMADARHAAMHQPAGPEVVTENKLA